MTNNDAKILIYDFETTDLDADWGTAICMGFKWLHDPGVTVLSLTDYKGWKKDVLDDRRLWQDFMDVYNQADLTVGYFNSGFDRPFMYARLLKHRIMIPANVPTIDLFYTAKSNMKLRRKSMDNVTRFLGLQDDDVHKTPVGGELWQRARVGNEEAIKAVVEHCRSDIFLTERLYLMFRPLIRTHPRIKGWEPCRACGSFKLQKRGQAMTITKGPRWRVQCQDCGSWESRSIEHSRGAVA